MGVGLVACCVDKRAALICISIGLAPNGVGVGSAAGLVGIGVAQDCVDGRGGPCTRLFALSDLEPLEVFLVGTSVTGEGVFRGRFGESHDRQNDILWGRRQLLYCFKTSVLTGT